MPSIRRGLPTPIASGKFGGQAEDWNRLWERADVSSPALLADSIDCWLTAFSQTNPLQIIGASQDGELRIALPLVRSCQVKYPAPVAALPGNEWGLFGELLLDPDTASSQNIWDEFFDNLCQLPFWLFRFEPIPFEAQRWRLLRAEATRRGWQIRSEVQFHSPHTRIQGTWEQYLTNRSPARLRNRYRGRRKLESAGEWRVVRHQAEHSVDDLVSRALEVEHRSWKGRAGTSLLSDPEASGFYRELCRLLAVDGFLELWFLELDGVPISSSIGWQAKGDHFLVKIGYDEQYSAFGPGQLLIMEQLRHYFNNHQGHKLDFCGRVENWSRDWATDLVPLGRLDLVPPSATAKALYKTYAFVRSTRDRHSTSNREVRQAENQE